MNKFITILALSALLFVGFSYEAKAQEPALKVAEVQPEPIGGLKSFFEYLETNLQYPQEAKNVRLEGRVMVRFVVELDGSLKNIEVVKGIGGGCDEEAVRLIKNAPKWSPGKNAGKPVRVEVTRPIAFKLQ